MRELEAQAVHPDFWKDNVKAQEVMKEISGLKEEMAEVGLAEAAVETEDPQAESLVSKLELRIYLSAPYI